MKVESWREHVRQRLLSCSSPSTMTSSSPSSSSPSSSAVSLDDHDESVRIAVCALGDMKKGTRASPCTFISFCVSHMLISLSGTSRSSPPTSPAPDSVSPDFVSRVTSLPLVGTALRAYEHGKASSRVVKVRIVHPFWLPVSYRPTCNSMAQK